MRDETELDFDPAQRAGDRSNQYISIDNGKTVATVAVCAALCGVSASIAIWAGYQAQVMTTEYRVQIGHTMRLEAEQDALKTRVEIVEKDHDVQRR